MAVSKRSPRTIQQEDIEEVFPPQPPPLQLAAPEYLNDDDDAFNNVLSELGASSGEGGGGFVTVYQEVVSGNSKREQFRKRYDVADFTEGNLIENIQHTFGGGVYHIRVYRNGIRGIYKYRMVDIGNDPTAQSLSSVAVSVPPVDLSPLTQQLSIMQVNFEKLLSAIASTQPKVKTTVEFLQEMQMMREIFSSPVAPPAVQPVTQVMDAMKMGMELAAMNQGGDSNNAWALKAMEMFGKPIMEAVMSGQLKPAPATSPHRALPISQQSIEALPIPQQSTEEENAMSLMIKGYLKMLASAAAQNKPVEEYADGILDILPASELSDFDALLRSPDWQIKLAVHSNAVNEHPIWFTNLRNTIIEFRDSDIAEAQAENNRNLTSASTDDSVRNHENDDTGTTAQDNHISGTA